MSRMTQFRMNCFLKTRGESAIVTEENTHVGCSVMTVYMRVLHDGNAHLGVT